MRLVATISLVTVSSLFAPLGSKGSTGGVGANGSYYAQARTAVCHHFGRYCDQAMSVARCETGGTYYPWASNGQYLGIFQMGSSERARYGHGNNVWAQAKAAYRYFVSSGRDWSPWACKPW